MRFSILVISALALAAVPAMVGADEVSDDDLQTFATIYTGMEQARTQLSQELAAAESPEQAEEIRTGANDRMVAVIEDNGWSLDRYNEVAAAINENAELRSRVLDLLQSDSRS